jgi:glycerol-3-phosphate dehydrogenase/glycerophosphoryl diester phosphodiesterase
MPSNKLCAVAHRGYAAKYPENTILALREAIKAGAHLVELDVQLSSDLVPVMLHDGNFVRTTSVDKSIFEITSEEIKCTEGLEQISTLEDVMVWLKEVSVKEPKVKAFVELKQESIDFHGLDACMEAVSGACKDSLDLCIFISFNADAVSRAKALGFKEIGWVLPSHKSASFEVAKNLAPEYLFANINLLPQDDTPLKKGCWKWIIYEIVSKKIAAQLIARGAHGIETMEIEKMLYTSSHPHFDVVVIGGGIHGAGIAQAASAAGYSVLTIEKTHLAHGTSSRSSKLIHGGLRYLETAQIKLVFECLSERALLLKLAPDLVRLEPFYIPIYKNTRRRPWEIRAGLSLYALLGKLRSDALFVKIPQSSWHTLDGLDTKDLQAVFCYKDGATDDAALTRAVMNSAISLGAELSMPAEFIKAEAHVDHNTVYYSIDGKSQVCTTGLLVNTAGPWANTILDRVTPIASKLEFDLIAGSHIILDAPSPEGIYYVEAPQDGRAVFVMPWKGKTMIGTTETPFMGNPSDVEPLQSEIDYLLEVAAAYFPKFSTLSTQDVSSSFAGLRVLPHSKGRAFSRPRETTFHVDKKLAPRVATIYGGKLTAYRITSEKFVSEFSKLLPNRKRKAYTSALPLTSAL